MIKQKSIFIALTVYLVALLVFSLGLNAQEPSAAPTSAPTPKKRISKMFAVFDTDMGSFKAKLFFTQVPKTVENFVGYAEGTKEWTDPSSKKPTKRPLYDGVMFHRVIDGFMIQTGDPKGDGTGGSGNPNIPDEFKRELRHDRKGILSMANIGQPNTGDTQFFITLAPTKHLDDKHAVFGEVVDGMNVVEAIGKVPTTGRPYDKPLKPVRIKSIKIVRE